METNAQLELARKIIEETDTSLFLTGKAGTGKTTFLKRLRRDSPKRMVVLAPTGIAALNAGGVTLHSFFQLPFAPHIPGAPAAEQRFKVNERKQKLIRSLELIVIDEISMVRADLLDAVDDALRRIRRNRDPFGGVQMLLIGDLQQLAPVAKDAEWALLAPHYASPYFFDSRALRQTDYVTLELTTVYRQSDSRFLSLLNKVRCGAADTETLAALNSRYIPAFTPPKEEGYIRLVTHNWQADGVNRRELGLLPGASRRYTAKVTGNFPESSYPAEKEIELKVGAQVMFVKNDTNKRYVNGMLATVTSLSPDGIRVRTNEGGESIDVAQDRWENTRYTLDAQTGEIKEQVEGAFIQYPVKLAWAITVHKSQGLTFDRVMIDASAAFAHGQTYVALSRCRTLEGIVLTSPIPPSAVIADKRVEQFTAQAGSLPVDGKRLSAMRGAYATHLLFRLFSFERERVAVSSLVRLMQEHVAGAMPETVRRWEEELSRFDLGVMGVAGTFHRQITRILGENGNDASAAPLQERLRKGAGYFRQQLRGVEELCDGLSFAADNKDFGHRRDKLAAELGQLLAVHVPLLETVEREGFVAKSYTAARARLALAAEDAAGKPGSVAKAAKTAIPAEVANRALYTALVAWRQHTAARGKMPAYAVFSNRALIGIANSCPTTLRELLAVPTVGKAKAERYGAEVLDIVDTHAGLGSQGSENAAPAPAPTQVGKEKKEKEKKPASDLISLELYKKGMGIEAISEARSLAVSTVAGHLMQHIGTGEVDIRRLVPADHITLVEKALAGMDNPGEARLADIRSMTGDIVSFAEVRMVQEAWRAREGKA